MSDEAIDVLMRVVGPNGAFEAESNTVFAPKPVSDLLRHGFTPGQFCEQREFSFSAGVGASLSKHAQDKEKEKKKQAAAAQSEGRLTYREKMETIYQGQYKKASKREKNDDFVDMQPVEFTRVMDAMSSQLFQSLVGCDTLDSISVVKRKAAGTANSGDCYLRLDFSKVLLTNLEWKDSEHLVLETGTFIYRKLTMRYRPQKADGSLDVAIQSEWEMQAMPVPGRKG